MQPEFWHERWQRHQIGFHLDQPNPALLRHFPALGLAPGSRVLVPLCGKTRDIGWLMSQGMRVAGAELSRIAVAELFGELGVTPDVAAEGPLWRHSAPGIDIFAGEIFDLSADRLGPVDAVYDRAALVALPRDLRTLYAAHLRALTDGAPQLVICFEYDQSLRDGPPFSVDAGEIARLYGADHPITLLDGGMPGDDLRGAPARETVWLLG